MPWLSSTLLSPSLSLLACSTSALSFRTLFFHRISFCLALKDCRVDWKAWRSDSSLADRSSRAALACCSEVPSLRSCSSSAAGAWHSW